MNKRRRELLDMTAPIAAHVLGEVAGNIYSAASPLAQRAKRNVPGLALNASNGAAELMIYGPIGGSFWDGGITAVDVAQLLRDAGPVPITARINSPGGDVFQGVAIHTLLARHPGTVSATIDGLAASAASVVMLAADHITAPRGAFVMVHDAMTGTYGNGKTHRTSADLLDKVSEAVAEMYSDRAGEDAAFWRDLMNTNGEDGFWYTGSEAMDAGLIDGLIEAPDEDEATTWNRLSTWENVLPAKIAAALHEHRKIEVLETPALAWDPSAFATIMKEALA
jgi:ATP-dependent protease ClpP protease subunit